MGEAHPSPFRTGQNAPTGAHGDRGGFPTDKDSLACGVLTSKVVHFTAIAFQHYVKESDVDVSLPGKWGEAILPQTRFRGIVEFYEFDKEYVEKLRNGEPVTEQHFVAYFGQLLRIKLRSRMLTSDRVEDLQQETFIRVIGALRKEGGVRQPERFGAFVNSICNNVLMEHYRSLAKSQPLEDPHLEIPDKVLDLDGMLVTKQLAEGVRKTLDGMPQRDRDLLRAIFLEEKDKDAVCRQFGVDRGYLRVLLHRAKEKFKALYEKSKWK